MQTSHQQPAQQDGYTFEQSQHQDKVQGRQPCVQESHSMSQVQADVSSMPEESELWLRGVSHKDPFQDDWSDALSQIKFSH